MTGHVPPAERAAFVLPMDKNRQEMARSIHGTFQALARAMLEQAGRRDFGNVIVDNAH